MPVHRAPASDSQSPTGEFLVLVFQAAELWRGPTRLPQPFRHGSDAPWPHALEVRYRQSWAIMGCFYARPAADLRSDSQPTIYLLHALTINQSAPPKRYDFASTLTPETPDPFLVVKTRRFNEPKSSFANTPGLTPHETARVLIALRYFPCLKKTRLMPKYASPRESLRNRRRSRPIVTKLASNSR